MSAEEETAGETFRFLFRVRYGECDPQNIVFNARWGDYVDIACTEYLRGVFGVAEPGAVGLHIRRVRQLIEWKEPAQPARFDDVIEAEVPTTSFTLAAVFRRRADGVVLAMVDTVYVSVVEDDGEVSERTWQLRPYALWAPVDRLRLEGQVRWTSRPESADGIHRRDREWLTSARGAWMFSPVAGVDLGLLRYDRSASGPPDVDVEGNRRRLVTRMLLQLGALWASFGVSRDLDPVGKGYFGGGGATLIVDR